MCSIMGYCGASADYERFMEGFEKTISRGPDDSRVVDTGNGCCDDLEAFQKGFDKT